MKLAPINFGQVIKTVVPSSAERDIVPVVYPYKKQMGAVFYNPVATGPTEVTILTERDASISQLALMSLYANVQYALQPTNWLKKFMELTGVQEGEAVPTWYINHSEPEITQAHQQLEPGVVAEWERLSKVLEAASGPNAPSGKPN